MVRSVVRLGYLPPYDWDAMLGFLAARAVEGVEAVRGDAYRRTFVEDGERGSMVVAHDPTRSCLVVTCQAANVSTPRLRRLFDLDADVATIGGELSRDPLLSPLVHARPGLRVPGAWDGFELGVRAILGQQVTLGAGRKLAGRLVALCAETLTGGGDERELTRVFPSAERLLASDLSGLGMPAARRATLVALAEAAVADPQLFTRPMTAAEAVERFRSIRGIGEWTAQYIALRALRLPDAFPPGDAALIRSVGALLGERPTSAGLVRRAEAWRPWRSYAAQHLWTAAPSTRGVG